MNHALADALVDQELVKQIKSVYMQNDLKVLAMTWNMGQKNILEMKNNPELFFGNNVEEYDFEADIFGSKKEKGFISSKLAMKANATRRWFNSDIKTFPWKTSEDILQHYKPRRHVWTQQDPTFELVLSLLRALRSDEGVRISELRLLELVPTDEDIEWNCIYTL